MSVNDSNEPELRRVDVPWAGWHGLVWPGGVLAELYFLWVFKNCVAFKIKTPPLFFTKSLPLEFA